MRFEMEEIYYDIINGIAHPYTWEEVLDTVSEHLENDDPNTPWFFSACGNYSYSVSDIKNIIAYED